MGNRQHQAALEIIRSHRSLAIMLNMTEEFGFFFLEVKSRGLLFVYFLIGFRYLSPETGLLVLQGM